MFVHALTLAAIVLIAAAVPLFVWRGSVVGSDPAGESALVWLALPVVVALVAAYGISTRITRRFVHALAAVERNQR